MIGAAVALAAALASPAVAGVGAVPLGQDATVPRPAVVVLWATWCAPCMRELPLALRLAPAALPLPLVTLALDPPEAASARLAALHLATDYAFAAPAPPGEILARLGGKQALLPLTIGIDANGRICGRFHGILNADALRSLSLRCRRKRPG